MLRKSSFSRTKHSRPDEKGEKHPKVHPTPSKVNHRLEIARQIPIAVNSKKMLLLRYRNILMQNGNKADDLKCIEEILEKYGDNSDEEVSFQGDVSKNDSKNFDEDQASNEPLESSNVSNRDVLEIAKNLKLDLRNQKINDDNFPKYHDKESQTPSPEHLPNNWKRIQRHSYPLIASFEEKQNSDVNTKDHSRRSLPAEYRQLKPNHVDFLRNLRKAILKQENQLSNSEAHEEDVNFQTKILAESSVGDIKTERFVETSLVESLFITSKTPNETLESSNILPCFINTKGLTLNPKKNLDEDIEAITIKLNKCFKNPSNEPNCICKRIVRKTFCKACGGTMSGRVLRHCKDHPKASLPGDHSYCTMCFADITLLREILDE